MAGYSEVRQFTRIILESQNVESIARAQEKHNVKCFKYINFDRLCRGGFRSVVVITSA